MRIYKNKVTLTSAPNKLHCILYTRNAAVNQVWSITHMITNDSTICEKRRNPNKKLKTTWFGICSKHSPREPESQRFYSAIPRCFAHRAIFICFLAISSYLGCEATQLKEATIPVSVHMVVTSLPLMLDLAQQSRNYYIYIISFFARLQNRYKAKQETRGTHTLLYMLCDVWNRSSCCTFARFLMVKCAHGSLFSSTVCVDGLFFIL